MKFEIKLYEVIGKLCLYTVYLEGNPKCETDLFIERFEGQLQFADDLTVIKQLLVNMGKYGARPERFREEDNAHALPKTTNNLRLYCIRCTDYTLILGGGGRKTSQKVKDSPDCYPHFQRIKQIERLFSERVAERSITYNGRFLDGDLLFDTNPF